MENWAKYDETFRYMMLSRMKMDCDYYLGNGGGNPDNLWACDEFKQIENMRAIWNTFVSVDKPEWLTYSDILNYAKEMGVPEGKFITIRNGKYNGIPISEYGIENGYLDYRSLARIIGPYILNNSIRDNIETEWDVYCGNRDEAIMNEYIIDDEGAEFLKEFTDELVFYNPESDIYIWAVCHTNTAWHYVLTDTALVELG